MRRSPFFALIIVMVIGQWVVRSVGEADTVSLSAAARVPASASVPTAEMIPVTGRPSYTIQIHTFAVSVRALGARRGHGDYHYCSGVMITSSWVLTAAHCISAVVRTAHYAAMDEEDIVVVVGTNRLVPSKPPLRNAMLVKKLYMHENYNRKQLSDLALIHLRGVIIPGIPLSRSVRLPTMALQKYQNCKTIGWGRQHPHADYANEMLQQDVYADPEIDATGHIRVLPAYENQSLFLMDTGAPLFCNQVLYGIARGISEKEYNSQLRIYTGVYEHLDWLLVTMRNNAPTVVALVRLSLSLNLCLLFILDAG
ncbi:trypsin-3 [Drosophila busckii]|uniref:trypsin-3 n=1 Tax=Drosophila busckii TaxID=30019 RepID=UPI00083F3E78|nr:trypsin-3 [Drosophila busckii]